MKRYNHDRKVGLTNSQVQERIKNNLTNRSKEHKTKTVPKIISDNFFTLFNLLNFFLAFLILLTGSYKNLLFLGVVFCNTIISTVQEIRSKKIVDRLSLIASTKATVLRDGKKKKIELEELVIDDIIYYELGNQVVVDSILLEGECEVNEAFITGEIEPILKRPGDMILSGSFLVSGECVSYVEHVGEDNYTVKISTGAKKLKKIDSEMMLSLKKIIKWISICIIPIGILLFFKQFELTENFNISILHTVAALIGMIPEGLILLTSTVLAVSVVRLSKYKVLVQELYCIESLAYVDTLCLDKTGTITEGTMEVESIIPIEGSMENLEEELSIFLTLIPSKNATYEALRKKFPEEKRKKVITIYPFSSERKWSGVTYEKESYVLGAPERLLNKTELEKIKRYEEGFRVLAFCSAKSIKESKVQDTKLKAIILISDKIRSTAKETLAYFKKQGVEIKLISGDSVETVSSIAKKVGVHGLAIDTSTLTKEELLSASTKYTIFGRVNPDIKRELIKALKEQGHKVAMTGDGVNDVLALKEADCSIAMNSGTDAARNVSQLVLLDSNFDALPKVLEEGRRTINNIQRSATLFLVKTIYASILAILFIFLPFHYPFEPIQMSLTSMFTIGIPSFVLALEPNKELVKGNFLINVLKRAFPTAFAIVLHILIITILGPKLYLTPKESSTLCVFTTAYLGFLLLYHICKPFNFTRKALLISLVIGYLLEFLLLRDFYSLAIIDLRLLLGLSLICLLGFCIFELEYYCYLKFLSKD